MAYLRFGCKYLNIFFDAQIYFLFFILKITVRTIYVKIYMFGECLRMSVYWSMRVRLKEQAFVEPAHICLFPQLSLPLYGFGDSSSYRGTFQKGIRCTLN